jgi:rod shape-determining protein MreC
MYRLYLFLFKYRVTLIFIFLEVLSFWLIVQNNRYQSAAFFNSSNAISANLLSISSEIRGYFSLKKTNTQLAEEIANLRKELERKKVAPVKGIVQDSAYIPYEFVTAKVISNSAYNFNNYLTINRGNAEGVKPDMAVIGPNGFVGKIKYTSENFAVVTSLLHSNFLISSKVEGKINLCSTQWDGVSPSFAQLLFVPTHIVLLEGDTVSASGFNSIFPEDILIGTVSKISLREGAPFHEIEIKLSTEFANLSFVQVIISAIRDELDSLGVNKRF